MRTAGAAWLRSPPPGFSPRPLVDDRGAVLLMYAWTAAVSFGLVAIALTHQVMVAALVLLAVVLLAFLTRRPVRPILEESRG